MSTVNKPEAAEKENKSGPDVMKEQEAKLRAKYPGIKPGAGGSSLLHKRLSKGAPKYFDSGDYNMAKAKMGSKINKPVVINQQLIMPDEEVTGDTIPTPESVPQRKHSLHLQSKLAASEDAS